MAKERLKVEWAFPTDEQTWQALTVAPEPQAGAANTAPTRRYLERVLAVLMVALVLLVAGVWTWQGRSMEVAVPVQAQVMTPVSVPESLEGNVVVDRMARLYGQPELGRGWGEADHTWLGQWQTIYTTHFVIRYRRVDALAVAEVAPRLERIYERLRRDFGLPADPPFTDDPGLYIRPDITVVITGKGEHGYFRYDQRTLVVTSPATRAIPVEISAATYIVQSVVHPLSALLATDLVKQHQSQWQGDTATWQPLLAALSLWAFWEEEGPLSVWQEDTVRWLYHNAHAPNLDAHQAVPDSYADLCRAYRELGLSPLSMAIPLTCRSVPDQWINRSLPLQLDELDGHQRPPVHDQSFFMWGSHVVAMTTIIDYVVATYDRPALARWLAALGDHTGWETLVPAVFGIPAADFEAGWQAYLADRYDEDTQ